MSKYSLTELQRFQNEAMNFFAAELMLMKDIIPQIKHDRTKKASALLRSCGQTGHAVLQLSSQLDIFSHETMMLARAIMEKLTNFCYVCVCDEKEFRAFVLHPVYKYYHSILANNIEDHLSELDEFVKIRTEKQARLKEIPVVKEALAIFSETKSNKNWTNKTLDERIAVIGESEKILNLVFIINKFKYYSDASEVLHGSLYGCTLGLGLFEPGVDQFQEDTLDKMINKENTCMLLHLGCLIHECITLISHTSNISELWSFSDKNRSRAWDLLTLVREIDIKKILQKFSENE